MTRHQLAMLVEHAMPAFCDARDFDRPEYPIPPSLVSPESAADRHIPVLLVLISARRGHRVLGPRRETLILIFAVSLLAQAQPPDYHVTADPFHATYGRSAFLHGHRHGYEDGYHAADQDLHLGRQPQIFKPKFRVPKLAYRSEYGSKASFRHGYEAGYIAGYSDSYIGRQFNHPPEQIAAVPEKAPNAPQQQLQASTTSATDTDFDSGVYEGYRSAVADQANFELHLGLAQYAEDFCRQKLIRGAVNGFCTGYGSGFVLGKSDAARKIRSEGDNVIRVAENQR